MTRWIVILILAILGTALTLVGGFVPTDYGPRAGWVGAGLIGLAVCLIAAGEVG